ncbi:MAG: hypothetical protein J5666_07445 [Bacilli bacterium]|nr:hypothetical protein [Bacilli bacterium]
MKKYILLFGCILLSLFFINCKRLDIKRLDKLLEDFYKDGNYYIINVNVDIFGQEVEGTSRVCADPFYLDLDGTGKTAYMLEGDYLFLYEFKGKHVKRTLVGKMSDKDVADLVGYGEPIELDLSKCEVSYNKKTKEYTIECNPSDALPALESYMGNLGINKSTLDELFIFTISCNKEELFISIESKVKNPRTNEKEDFELDINIKKEKFTIPSTDNLYTQEPSSIYEVVNMSNVGDIQYLHKNSLQNDYVSYAKYHLDEGKYFIIFNDGDLDNYRQDCFQFYDANYNRIKVNKVVDVDKYMEFNCLFEITQSGDYYLYVRAFKEGTKYHLENYTNNHEVHDIKYLDNLSGEIESTFDYHLMEFTSYQIGCLKITNIGLENVYIMYYRDDISPRWDKKVLKADEYFNFPIYVGENKMYIVSQFDYNMNNNHYDFDIRFERIYSYGEKIILGYDYGEEFNVIYGEKIECEFEITEAGNYTISLTNKQLEGHIYYDYRIKTTLNGTVDRWYLVPGTYVVTVFLTYQNKGTFTTTKAKLVKLD